MKAKIIIAIVFFVLGVEVMFYSLYLDHEIVMPHDQRTENRSGDQGSH